MRVPDDAFTCEVEGCQRWSRKMRYFLCGRHWMALSRADRRVMRRIWRTIKLIGGWNVAPPELIRREQRCWDRCVKRAAENLALHAGL